jgi:hypothetical protein
MGGAALLSEFNPWGQLIFNAELPAGVNTYRAYLLLWGEGGSGSPWYPGGSRGQAAAHRSS